MKKKIKRLTAGIIDFTALICIYTLTYYISGIIINIFFGLNVQLMSITTVIASLVAYIICLIVMIKKGFYAKNMMGIRIFDIHGNLVSKKKLILTSPVFYSFSLYCLVAIFSYSADGIISPISLALYSASGILNIVLLILLFTGKDFWRKDRKSVV